MVTELYHTLVCLPIFFSHPLVRKALQQPIPYMYNVPEEIIVPPDEQQFDNTATPVNQAFQPKFHLADLVLHKLTLRAPSAPVDA